ncbi:unnamed protein product [Timema podura]|uniref:ZAD domain-containing protein n=1 Tax=Timema podura TaxID=61482 RepID=A0ABN7NZ56_TIMPD|nr:unnamed protein product [Timema podura]
MLQSCGLYTTYRIQVQENDYYSKFICLECFSKLNNFFEFSKTCVNSDITMRNIHNPETPLSQVR